MSYTYHQGRVYVHKTCGGETRITEQHFAGLCNPFEPCSGTICAACGMIDSTKGFNWADTGELVSEYRKRLRREASGVAMLWAYLLSPAIGAAIGGWVGITFFNKAPTTDALLGGGIGVALMFFLVGPKILTVIGGKQFYTKQ